MLSLMSKELTYSIQNQIRSNLKLNCFKSQLLYLLIRPRQEYIRTTYVLRRKYPIQLLKHHESFDSRRLRPYDYVYEVVENKALQEPEPLTVLLIKPVPGIGSPGQLVDVRRNVARLEIILPGLGVYASPENIKKYSYLADLSEESKPSSPSALKTVLTLERKCYNVSMNMDNPWKIEPWHIRIAFRRAGVCVPEYALTLPEKPITGPDLNIEGREFLVKIKINNREEALVRMRLHHISTDPDDRLPFIESHKRKLAKPLFVEEAEILDRLNRNDPNMIAGDDES